MKNSVARAAAAAALMILGAAAASAAPASAAAWEQVSTRHFLFIFEPRDRPYVDELLGFAEDVYDKVTAAFDSYPAVVPCILRGRVDEANGLTMSFPSRIDLYVTAPTDHFLGARTESWLKVLLTHELTHFVHQSMSTGLWHALSVIFGGDLSSLSFQFLPGWAVEGPAVYEETVLSQGGRGRNPLFEMFTRAAVEDGSLFSYQQAAYLSPFPPPGRIYVGGYALVDWLETTYGAGTFARIMKEFLDFPFPDPDAAIRRVTGRDPAQVFADMRKEMIRRAAPFLQIAGGKPVTPESNGNWSHPQPTNRGLYLYRTRPGAFPAIVRWDPAGQAEQVLVKAALTDGASFSATADGSSVWFSTLRIDDSRPAEERSSADLWLLDVSSGRAKQVTFGAHLWHPAVSRDGGRLLAVQGAGPYTRLVSVDTESGAVRVEYSRAGANVYSPALSPDGRTVAFVLNVRGFQDVYVADLASLDAGSRAVEDPRSSVEDVNLERARPVIGPDAPAEYFPSFVDNATLLFSSDRSGSLALYSADLAGGGVALIQRDPVAAIAGVEDGETLLYESYRGQGYAIEGSPLSTLQSEPLDPLPEALPYPEPAPAASDIPAVRYADLPAPYLWLPSVPLVAAGPGAFDLGVGLGAHVEGGSLLGITQWTADAAWLTGQGQPVAGAGLSTWFGPLGVDGWFNASYSWTGAAAPWEQFVQGGVDLSWKIMDEMDRDIRRSLMLGVGVNQAALIDGLSSFTLAQSLAAPAQYWFTYLGIPAQVHYSWQQRGGQVDFNPPLALDVLLSGVIYPALFSLGESQGEVDMVLSANLPVSAHSVMKLGVKAAQDFGGPFSSYSDALTVPRGFGSRRYRAYPGGLLGSLDYLVPLGLLDTPLLLGWGLTAAGLGMHVEGAADFDAGSGGFAILPFVFAGIDLSIRLAFDGSSLPVGAGISVAVNAANPGSFNPATDLGLYFFAGFDSSSGAARKAPAADPVQGRGTTGGPGGP